MADMRYLCSQCHAGLEAEPEDEHKVCPSCKAEAGLEPIKETVPDAMRYFGAILLTLSVLAIGGVAVGMMS